MKYLVVMVIAFAACVAADEEWKPTMDGEKFVQIHKDCVKESGVTSEQEAKLVNHERPDEKEVHAYVLCNVKKLGIFNEETGYNADRIVAQLEASHLDAKKSREIVDKCIDSNDQKTTVAEWAYRNVQCMLNNGINDLVRETQEAMKKIRESRGEKVD